MCISGSARCARGPCAAARSGASCASGTRSALAVEESTTYDDVDAFVLSGFLHSLGPGVEAVGGALYPAAFDPKFAGVITDQGYLTTQPGPRSVFYWLPGADPAVVAQDETLKEQVSFTSTSEIVANETPYWPNAPRLDVAIVPLAGHDVNLHRTAPVFFLATRAWLAAHAA
jgi:hypothetical protein